MEKVKEFLVKALAWVKAKIKLLTALFKKIVKFFQKNGKWFLHGINLVVVALAYNAYPEKLLTGIWLFLLLAYYLFWKILRAETLFQKDEDDRPPLPGM